MLSPTILGQALTAGGLAGARPLLVVALTCLWVRVFAEVPLPSDLAWLVHDYTLAGLAVLAIVEHAAAQDIDLREWLHVPLGAVAVMGGVLAARLVTTTGAPAVVGIPVPPPGIALAGIGLGDSRDLVAMAVAAAAAGTVQVLKAKVLRWLDDLMVPGRWLRWLEAGGVLGTMAAILLVPVLAVVLAVALTGVSVAVFAASRVIGARIESARRRPCPLGCGQAVRVEASRCPGCHGEVGVAEVVAA